MVVRAARALQFVLLISTIVPPQIHAQFAGPAVSPTSRVASAPPSAMSADFPEAKIMPGDIIAISAAGVPEITTSTPVSINSPFGSSTAVAGIKVGATGEVVLAYLGETRVAGLTAPEVAKMLSKRLSEEGYLVDPQISVQLVDSPTRVVTVVGEVQKPTLVPAFGPLRLLDVISSCGGFTPLASHVITIRRLGEQSPMAIELGTDPEHSYASNIPLLPGDTVIVPRVGDVYVLGEVKSPAAFPLSSNTPLTVMRAIAMAGGLKYSAALSKSKLLHTTSNGQRIERGLDLSKIMHQKEPDVILSSDDVLIIPSNAFKAALSNGGAAVAATSLYGVAYIAK